MIKFSEFLKQNNISFYKMAQLLGRDPLLFTGSVKAKALGEKNIKFEEFKTYCQKLSDFIHKPVNPEDFEVEDMNRTVRLK